MATTPSQKPVASELPQDMKFNSGKIDEFVTSLALKYIDRLGGEHYTIEGIKQLAFEAMSNFGYVTISSFDGGATLTDPNQALLWESNGEYYKWTGNLPKTVPAGSTPDSTGGIGPGAWLSIGDSLLRSMLASSTGSQLIGTNHRGTLELDLDAIDRRPDGYANSIQAVLSNGQDVQISDAQTIDSRITINDDYQVIQGLGGSVANINKGQALFADTKAGVKIKDFRCIGLITNGPATGNNVAYAITFTDSSNISIVGSDTYGYTGSVYLQRCVDSIIRDTYSRGNRYHSDVVAGGYGVLLGGCKRIIVDGVNFEADADKGDLGRHAVYVSVIQGAGNFCEDIIVKNIIARYNNINDRNMWGINIRKSNRVIVDDFIINGANAGVALNTADGVINQCQIKNGHVRVLQYDGNAVYGLAGTPDDSSLLTGLVIDGVSFEMEVKAGVTPTAGGLVPIALNCQRSRVSNIKILGRGDSNAFLLGSCSQLTIDGVSETLSGGASTSSFIRFTAAASGISVYNISTPRASMFQGLDNVTNLSVDFDRFARIVSNNSAITITDSSGLIASATITGTGEITVGFKSHVTDNAIRSSTIGPASTGAPIILPEFLTKSVILRFYTAAGVLVNLSASIVSADVSLH
ncbi:hypothetical protein IGF01_002227, partial [Escherichia coli]|nr:hypothetical protein [Escherichia coli]EGI4383917.1 hypothetical protein [Escherichia coli]EIW2736833.1 hypothetical protein [Escherichia coli]